MIKGENDIARKLGANHMAFMLREKMYLGQEELQGRGERRTSTLH